MITLLLLAVSLKGSLARATDSASFPVCAQRLDAPASLQNFLGRLDQLRRADLIDRRAIDTLIADSEYTANLALSAQRIFSEYMIDPRRAGLPARTLLAGVIKNYARRNPAGSLFAPIFRSLRQLETHFDPARVVELNLIPELLGEVMDGTKTSTIRADHVWDLKSGPALFRVAGTAITIPVVIKSVHFRRNLDFVSDDELRAQGPFVAERLQKVDRWAATDAIAEAMARYYPGFSADDEVTVVRFRRLPQ